MNRSALLVFFLGLSVTLAAPERESVAGVRVGDSIEEARRVLDAKGKSSRSPNESSRSAKEAWTLDATEFANVALKVDASGRVVWITGFVRPGAEIAFENFGELSKATSKSKNFAVWDWPKAKVPYRLIARGGDGKARVVSLVAFSARSGGDL